MLNNQQELKARIEHEMNNLTVLFSLLGYLDERYAGERTGKDH